MNRDSARKPDPEPLEIFPKKRKRGRPRCDPDGESVWLYVPEGFISKLEASDSPLPAGTRRGVLQFMDEMFRQKNILEKEEVRLKASILQENIINWNRGVQEWVVESGLFIRKGGYKPGHHAYTYDFTRHGARLDWKCEKVSDPIIYRSMKKRQRKMVEKLTGLELWLKNNIDRIIIDWKAFYQGMDMAERRLLRSVKIGSPDSETEGAEWQKYVLAKEAFRQIEDGQYWFFHDEFAHRVHSPITNLPKVARQYLCGPSGSPLVELDVGCSQPLFAAAVAKKAGFHCPEYQAECEAGTLYDTILAEIEDDKIKTRDDAKTAMFQYLYRAGYCDPLPIDQFIEQKYPTLHSFVKMEKDGGSDGNIQLAQKMQRLESDLVIQGLCNRVREFDPTIFVATIHDSLLVEPVHADLIQGWFTEAFQALGVRVHINKR